jgi:hypothetical protein
MFENNSPTFEKSLSQRLHRFKMSQGVPIRSNLPEEDEQTYSALLSQLAQKGSVIARCANVFILRLL